MSIQRLLHFPDALGCEKTDLLSVSRRPLNIAGPPQTVAGEEMRYVEGVKGGGQDLRPVIPWLLTQRWVP